MSDQVAMSSPLAMVSPVPFSFHINKATMEDGTGVIQISFFHPTGATVLICMPEEARMLASKLSETAGGIVVPSSEKLIKL